LLRAAIDEQGAFHELATVITDENAFTPEIKKLGLKAFAVYYALFLIHLDHFPFAFSPEPTEKYWRSVFSRSVGLADFRLLLVDVSDLSEILNRSALLRTVFGDRLMRSAICSRDFEAAASSIR
jgi:hypothetical protein